MKHLTTTLFLLAALLALPATTFAADDASEATNTTESTAASVDDAITKDDCYMPAAPIIPDGNVASEDELVAAQRAMKMFQESLVSFRGCISTKEKALDMEAEDYEAKGAVLVDAYNKSVDAEARVAEEFNSAVRAFKSRQ
ncbi:MAG: hypothetical protein HKN50_04165 [Gammaproteobacteria bacterium]|nr:hypothetical protein [Gammaproteobacteria bacterium]